MTTRRKHVPLLATAAVALAAATGAGAVEYPTLKNGQWEMTTTSSAPGAAPQKSTICLDAATQKMMIDMGAGMQKEMCSRMDMKKDGAKFITDAECKIGNSVIKSHGVMTMLSDTAYRTETSATFDPPFMKEMKETKNVIEGKYIGACGNGMQPGDMITPQGQKINLNQIQQRAAQAAPPAGAPAAPGAPAAAPKGK